jgi:hypothetical protein
MMETQINWGVDNVVRPRKNRDKEWTEMLKGLNIDDAMTGEVAEMVARLEAICGRADFPDTIVFKKDDQPQTERQENDC